MCLLFFIPEKHRGFAFIEFELAEVCPGYRAEVHSKGCCILTLTQYIQTVLDKKSL